MSQTSDVVRLRETQKGFFDQVVQRYEDGEWWRFAINLALVVGGGTLVAIGKLGYVVEPHSSWLTGVGLGLVFFGGALVAIFDRRRTSLTTGARDALTLAESFLDEKRALEDRIAAADALDQRRRHLLQAVQSMQEAVERIPQGTEITAVIEAMLDAGSNDLEGAIGFEPGEKWTFSVFRREPSSPRVKTEVMRRVAFVWADRSAEKGQSRCWKKNEGFTGVAWQRDQEVIEADIRLQGVREQYPISTENLRDKDETRYVSCAVIPIRVGSADDHWGSVTATSNSAGRWSRVATNPNEQNVQAVRMLAQLIAMQVALRNHIPQASFNGE